MNYNELAQRIVAQGILKYHGPAYFLMPDYTNIGTAREACTDGRVVLALMEKATEAGWYPTGCPGPAATVARSATPTYGVYLERNADSLAIAIVLACLDALEKDKCN